MLDRFTCYELCVQSPSHLAAFLLALHANAPVILREDFCGSAAVSRAWVQQGQKRADNSRAIATDIDEDALNRARTRANEAGLIDRIHFIQADLLQTAPKGPPPTADSPLAPPDLLFVGNFSLGYFHSRPALLRYLKHAHSLLAPRAGLFVADTYGGASAFKLGGLNRRHTGPRGEIIHYSWVHERADPVTALVENAMSFRIEVDGEIVQELPRAFSYRWRLWSIPELRDALLESGFRAVEIYQELPLAPGHTPAPVQEGDLRDDWIVLVTARA